MKFPEQFRFSHGLDPSAIYLKLAMKTKANSRKKRIVQTGTDAYESHRGDFKTCPHCGHEMENKDWETAATTLVLSPRCYKAGYVAVTSECPKCYESSWVHESMTSFRWSDWPEAWKEAVGNLEEATKLSALREWGASICHRCQHLKEGKVEYRATYLELL